MLSSFTKSGIVSDVPKEGDIYKELSVRDKTFTIHYGYYEEYERNSKFNDPIPIYPDFSKAPVYTDDGIPFATAMQDVCPHFMGKPETDGETCMDCYHFHKYEDLIGLCNCHKTKQQGGHKK